MAAIATRWPLKVLLLFALSVGAGLAVTTSPKWAFLLAAAAWAAYAALAWPRASAVAVAVAVLFSRMVTTPFPAASAVEDALIVGLFVLVAMRKVAVGEQFYRWPAMWPFLLFLAAGAWSSNVQNVPVPIASLDAFVLLKGVLFAYTVSQLDWYTSDFEHARRITFWVCTVIFGAVVANIVLGEAWASRFSIAQGEDAIRGGILSPVGPFGHPGFLGQAMTMLATVLVAYAAVYGYRQRTGLWLLLALGTLLLTLRRKAIIGLLGALAFVGLSTSRSRPLTIWIAVLGIPFIGFALWDALSTVLVAAYHQYILNASTSPRTILYSASYMLAGQHFPLGVGLGRYGTSVAFTHYSPVYYQLGFNGDYGLGPKGKFTTDTFWPAVLGETGVIGIIAYGSGILMLFWRAQGLVRIARLRANQTALFVGLVACGWSIDFLIESVASPAYNVAPLYVVFFGALGIAEALLRIA